MISTPGFREAKDIYGDPYEWDMENARACYRWLSRVVSRSPKQERFISADDLDELDRVKPLRVPLRIRETEHPVPAFERMGIFL